MEDPYAGTPGSFVRARLWRRARLGTVFCEVLQSRRPLPRLVAKPKKLRKTVSEVFSHDCEEKDNVQDLGRSMVGHPSFQATSLEATAFSVFTHRTSEQRAICTTHNPGFERPSDDSLVKRGLAYVLHGGERLKGVEEERNAWHGPPAE